MCWACDLRCPAQHDQRDGQREGVYSAGGPASHLARTSVEPTDMIQPPHVTQTSACSDRHSGSRRGVHHGSDQKDVPKSESEEDFGIFVLRIGCIR